MIVTCDGYVGPAGLDCPAAVLVPDEAQLLPFLREHGWSAKRDGPGVVVLCPGHHSGRP